MDARMLRDVFLRQRFSAECLHAVMALVYGHDVDVQIMFFVLMFVHNSPYPFFWPDPIAADKEIATARNQLVRPLAGHGALFHYPAHIGPFVSLKEQHGGADLAVQFRLPQFAPLLRRGRRVLGFVFP